MSLRLGLRAARALDRYAESPVRLKWPNDLYVADGKLAGILVEARWRANRIDWVAIGIGVNVRAPTDVENAASLEPGADRVDVLAELVPALRAAAQARGPLSASGARRVRRARYGRGPHVRYADVGPGPRHLRRRRAARRHGRWPSSLSRWLTHLCGSDAMILVFDVGNTETTIGLFDGEALCGHWRVTTDVARTPDEIELLHSFAAGGQ